MSTMYTTNGRPVGVAAEFGQAESDAVNLAATGAGAAGRAEETTSSAFRFRASPGAAGPSAAPAAGMLARCGPWCWIIGGILILVAIDALASSGAGA